MAWWNRGSVRQCAGSHVVVGEVHHAVSARWSCCSAVGVLLAGITRLAIEAQAQSRFPRDRGNTGSGISISVEAVSSSCPHEGNRDSRANVPTNFRVRALPLGREKGSHELDCSGGFHSAHTIDGEHEWSEVMTLITAGGGIDFLILLLLLFQDLFRVSTMVRFGIHIGDSDVKDH